VPVRGRTSYASTCRRPASTFANASLFHVPNQELPRVLGELRSALKPGGVLFSSNPRGDNEEGWNRGRYGAYHDLETWRGYLTQAGFTEIEHYYRPPGLPREQQPWLATVWRCAPVLRVDGA
jgi:SAM-dependent methyltransferase